MKRYNMWACQGDSGMSESINGEWVKIEDLASYAIIKKLEDRIDKMIDIINTCECLADDNSPIALYLEKEWSL